MVTKDWKKVQYGWKHNYKDIQIMIEKLAIGKYSLLIYNTTSSSGLLAGKVYKTKTEALKYAKEYMRKH